MTLGRPPFLSQKYKILQKKLGKNYRSDFERKLYQ